MCTNMFVWLLKILCQSFIAFDQNKIIYDKKKKLSVPITTNVVSSNPAQARCTQYNIM